MNAKQIVFLDTSVQIRRTLSETPESSELDAQVNAPTIQPVSSGYVWMEYQRTVIADFAYVHQLMQQYHDWGDLFRHILDGSRSFRPRSAVRCTQIVGRFYTRSGQDLKTAKTIIAEQIAHTLRQRFWTNVQSVSDAIVCDLVTKGVTRQRDGTCTVAASCRKDSATCHLPEFLDAHKTELQTLADYLAAHPHCVKDQPRLERLLSSVLRDPHAALGQASYWPLGDVIIALQVPADALLWTLDKDFTPLAQALAIPLYHP